MGYMGVDTRAGVINKYRVIHVVHSKSHHVLLYAIPIVVLLISITFLPDNVFQTFLHNFEWYTQAHIMNGMLARSL